MHQKMEVEKVKSQVVELKVKEVIKLRNGIKNKKAKIKIKKKIGREKRGKSHQSMTLEREVRKVLVKV